MAVVNFFLNFDFETGFIKFFILKLYLEFLNEAGHFDKNTYVFKTDEHCFPPLPPTAAFNF
jgi:hypothetical protein